MEVTYNSVLLNSIGLKVKSSNHTSLSSKSYESIKVPGKTGNLIIDDGSFENKKIELIFLWDLRNENVKSRIKQLRNLLQGHKGYRDLIFDDGFVFNAICSGEVVINDITKDYFEVNVVFDAYEKEV